MRLLSGEQRFYEWSTGFRFPLFFSGVAEVREWFDDKAGRFRIEVNVRNRVWGPLFGYNGSFEVEWKPCSPGGVPADVRPLREERRE